MKLRKLTAGIIITASIFAASLTAQAAQKKVWTATEVTIYEWINGSWRKLRTDYTNSNSKGQITKTYDSSQWGLYDKYVYKNNKLQKINLYNSSNKLKGYTKVVSRNGKGLVTKIKTSTGTTYTAAYNKRGQIVSVKEVHGTTGLRSTMTAKYDSKGRMTVHYDNLSGNKTKFSKFDKYGNPKKVVDKYAVITYTYKYDSKGRMIQRIRTTKGDGYTTKEKRVYAKYKKLYPDEINAIKLF